eukprot:g7346.t1
MISAIFLLSLGAEGAALPPGAEALSLFGKPLYPIQLTTLQNESVATQLEMARTALAETSAQCAHDPDKVVWLGRRTAYAWHYQEAVRIYTRELERSPPPAALAATKLLRHRGHRLLSTRAFAAAEADLSHAEALINATSAAPDAWEPDGQPNAANIPLSTLHFNVRYHLGLAHFLQGDYGAAADTYARCLADGGRRNDESVAATVHWRYMALRRLGREAEANATVAPCHAGMRMLEDASYLSLCLMYKHGGRAPGPSADALIAAARNGSSLDFSTVGFGIANWWFVSGDRPRAVALLREILDTPYWAAFGYVAAEADLFRWGSGAAA